jgi:hypothetical protein
VAMSAAILENLPRLIIDTEVVDLLLRGNSVIWCCLHPPPPALIQDLL